MPPLIRREFLGQKKEKDGSVNAKVKHFGETEWRTYAEMGEAANKVRSGGERQNSSRLYL